jgi:hypothetical protein
MEDSGIDLSALGLSRDKDKRSRMVESIVRRAIALRRRRLSITYQLQAWTRPAVALAVAAAIVAVVGSSIFAERESTTTAVKEETAFVVAEWAKENRIPPTATILDVLGGFHERN